MQIPEQDKRAVVVKNAGSHFLLSRLPDWSPFPAVLRGKVRLGQTTATNPVAVGDVVRYEGDEMQADAQHPVLIREILPRRNCLSRRSTNLSRQAHVLAANIDRAIVVTTLYFPEIKLPFLDRMLVSCACYGVPALIVLNKVDMYREEDPESVRHFCDIYEKAGYPVLQTAVPTGEGIGALREACRGKCSLLCGESGVGKSSLVHAIDPSLQPKIGRISDVHLQGKHTTSLYEMYPLAGLGFLIDSPGLRGFGLSDVPPDDVFRYFPEMLRVADDCRFMPCTHTHEPGCAVKAALEAGDISPERYASYLGMLEEDRKFR
ncbi:MAG: ribosome small subunit-dependent GTPase A [Bacteroidales bacterium]|nr:ribosome small subunit-dependent GTPase A [Bacteroidales bacterium]